jgi:hypothetical protein
MYSKHRLAPQYSGERPPATDPQETHARKIVDGKRHDKPREHDPHRKKFRADGETQEKDASCDCAGDKEAECFSPFDVLQALQP